MSTNSGRFPAAAERERGTDTLAMVSSDPFWIRINELPLQPGIPRFGLKCEAEDGGCHWEGGSVVSAADGPSGRPTSLPMCWARSPTASLVARSISDISGAVWNDSVDVVKSVLAPILKTLEFGFEYSSRGRCVEDCLGVVRSSGSCALGSGEGRSF